MVRGVVRAMKAMLQEDMRDTRDWVRLMPVVQWALNTAFRERCASRPHYVMSGRAPLRSFSTLASPTGGECRLDVLHGNLLRQRVATAIETQQEMHREVAEQVEKARAP